MLPLIVDLRLERYVLRYSSSVILSTWSTPWNHTAEGQRQGTSLVSSAQVHVHKNVPLLCDSLMQGQTPTHMCTAKRKKQERHSQTGASLNTGDISWIVMDFYLIIRCSSAHI